MFGHGTNWTLIIRIAAAIYGLVVALLLAMLIGQVLSARYNIVYYYSDVREVTDFSVHINGEERGFIKAPDTITNLNPGDKVVLRAETEYRMLNNLLLHVRSTPLTVFADNRLLYTCGGANTYPDFQKEPPQVVATVTLPETAAASQASGGALGTPNKMDLALEYTILANQNSLDLPRYYEGDKVLLFSQLLGDNAIGLILGLTMFLGSLTMIPIGLVIMRRAQIATSFIWLGLTCLACGIWVLAANPVVLYLVPQSSLLYTLSYVGFYLGIVPFLRFGLTFLRPKHRWPLLSLQAITGCIFIAITITHLSGVFCFAQWEPYSQIVEFTAMLLLTIDVLVEMLAFHNRQARILLVALGLFVVFGTLELCSQYWHFLQSTGELIQLGLLLLIVTLSFTAWQQVKDAFAAADRNTQLEAEIASVNRNLGMQQTLFETMVASSEKIRKLRHDMRHQLSAIRGMIEKGEVTEVNAYLDSLYGDIPSIADQFLCDNLAVNALAVHYQAIAQEAGIQCDLRLVVPKKVGDIIDNDLCVILGNLLENAIEACSYVEQHKRFIKLQTSVEKSRFTLVMDNSFDGFLKVRSGEFYSRKRGLATYGIGMQSVRAEVLKYDGAMKYETENEVFKTSLYLKMQPSNAKRG